MAGDFFAAVGRQIEGLLPGEWAFRLPAALLAAFAIVVFFNAVQLVLGRLARRRLNTQRTFVIRKTIKYSGFMVAGLTLFTGLGFNASALLGAAGVIGIAVGFASQTAVSSFISGFFLISEKPFQVGDAIRVDDIHGEVLSVDVLSVKLRTFDNLYIRIPNETLFKSNLVNLTRFPIRRLDLPFNVGYGEDLEKLRGILLSIAAENPFVLENPAPLFRVDGFERVGPQVNLTVWFDRNRLLDVRTSMLMEISARLAREGIEIPNERVEIREMGRGKRE